MTQTNGSEEFTRGGGLVAMHLPIDCKKGFKTYSFIDGDKFRMKVLDPNAVKHPCENKANLIVNG